jgi:hypothetical protein
VSGDASRTTEHDAREAIRDALDGLPDRPRSEPHRELRKAVRELDRVYDGYCRRFDERARKRLVEREAERRRIAGRADRSGDDAVAAVAAAGHDLSDALDDVVDTIDARFHVLCDLIVIAAAGAVHGDLVRAGFVMSAVMDAAITAAGLLPGANIPAALAGAAKDLASLRTDLSRKRRASAEDEAIARREAAVEIVRTAAQVVRAFAATVRA